MHNYTSKELYMANGGNKLYIYKDGFGDVYNATPAEEAEWAKEVVAKSLLKIDTENNRTVLEFAINDLIFHKHENIESLLIDKMLETSPARQIAFAAALWNIARYEKSFEIIYKNLQERRSECLDDVFLTLNNFRKNEAVQKFLLTCLEGDDDELIKKAQMTVGMWSFSGRSILHDMDLELLRPENKSTDSFYKAIEQLKKLFRIENLRR